MSRLRAMPGVNDSSDSLTASPDPAAPIVDAPSAAAPEGAAGGRNASPSSPFVSQSRLRTMSEPPPPPPGPATATQALDEIFQGTAAAGRSGAEAHDAPRVDDTGDSVVPVPSWPSMPNTPWGACSSSPCVGTVAGRSSI